MNKLDKIVILVNDSIHNEILDLVDSLNKIPSTRQIEALRLFHSDIKVSK